MTHPSADRPVPTLRDLPRERYGSPGMTRFGQLALAFAFLAPSWIMLQVATMVDYDGIGVIIGLVLGGILVPAATISLAVMVGLAPAPHSPDQPLVGGQRSNLRTHGCRWLGPYCFRVPETHA